MLFNRIWIKENSKARLGGTDRWNASLVTLIEMLIITSVSGFIASICAFSMFPIILKFSDADPMSDAMAIEFLLSMLLLYAVMIVLIVGVTVFVSGILQIGCMGWFMRFARGESPSVGAVFSGFKMYGKSLGTLLLTYLYVFLWSLLFFIPGIVKSYSYMMAPYLINDNPNLTPSQAIALSKKLTDGHKGDLFVMHLSFWGWLYLATLTPLYILGFLYVFPYYYTAMAGSYLSLKQMAIAEGRLSPAAFGEPVVERTSGA